MEEVLRDVVRGLGPDVICEGKLMKQGRKGIMIPESVTDLSAGHRSGTDF